MKVFILLFPLFLFFACQEQESTIQKENTIEPITIDTAGFLATLEKHLNAVSTRDLETLSGTLLPSGKMYFVMPQEETTTASKDFLDMHEAWFQDSTWTFETKITHSEISSDLGMAIVDVMYREPERDGKPYFNHMTVSYTLKKENGEWYIIKDHASSIEKG